jgi:hypothetical protein
MLKILVSLAKQLLQLPCIIRGLFMYFDMILITDEGAFMAFFWSLLIGQTPNDQSITKPSSLFFSFKINITFKIIIGFKIYNY